MRELYRRNKLETMEQGTDKNTMSADHKEEDKRKLEIELTEGRYLSLQLGREDLSQHGPTLEINNAAGHLDSFEHQRSHKAQGESHQRLLSQQGNEAQRAKGKRSSAGRQSRRQGRIDNNHKSCGRCDLDSGRDCGPTEERRHHHEREQAGKGQTYQYHEGLRTLAYLECPQNGFE